MIKKFSPISLDFLDDEQRGFAANSTSGLHIGKVFYDSFFHFAHGKRVLNPRVLFQMVPLVLTDKTLSLRFSKSLWEYGANSHWNIMKLVNFYFLASLENKPTTEWLHVDEFLINAWISGHTMIILNA